MRDAERQWIRGCRAALKDLVHSIQDRCDHWQALPVSIAAALRYARSLKPRTDRAKQLVCGVIETFESYESDGQIPFDRVVDLEKAVAQIRDRIRATPEAQTLGDALHATVEQHVALAAAGIQNLHQVLEATLQELLAFRSDELKRLVSEIEDGAHDCRPDSLSPANLSRLCNSLRKAVDILPTVPAARPRVPSEITHTHSFRIAIIEDNEMWQSFVLRAVDNIRERLGSAFRVEAALFENVQDARAGLCLSGMQAPSPSSAPVHLPETQTIAVVDMGLPADRQELAAVRAGTKTPLRSNGQAFLRELRAYRTNIPSIVLTTPPHLLDDQLRACEQGIEECSYILKGIDKQSHLVEALLHLIARGQGHQIEFWEGPNHEVRIDEVPIALNEMPFRTFYALSQLSQSSTYAATSEEVLDQLQETFGDHYDYKRPPKDDVERAKVLARQRSGSWWKSDWAMRIANVIRLWEARKAETGGDLYKALLNLKHQNFRSWQDALILYDLYRKAHRGRGPCVEQLDRPVDRVDLPLLAAGVEEAFGGFKPETPSDYDPSNIEKHVHEIRSAVHAAFNSTHRFIEPREEVIVRRSIGNAGGYRVLGSIAFHSPQEIEDERTAAADAGANKDDILTNRVTRSWAVLVIENDQRYRERICSLLDTSGFQVRVATNAEDAVAEALGLHRPDILCLDLHIPTNPEEFERDANSGDAANGLRALAHIRQGLPDIRVVIPTTHYDRDDLREWAAGLGVPVSNIVPKGGATDGASWEGHLLLTVSRLREEIWSGAVLPALPPWRCPVVQVLPGSDPDAGSLRLRVNGRDSSFRGKEGRLTVLLLQRHGDRLTYEEIDHVVWGKAIATNTRNQKINDVRSKIRTQWLGIAAGDRERPELTVLETVPGGLVLHAYVEWHPPEEESHIVRHTEQTSA